MVIVDCVRNLNFKFLTEALRLSIRLGKNRRRNKQGRDGVNGG